VALVAFFCIGAGWALALPVNGTYDEREHIIRAYGVASGQVYATKGTQDVPASLLPGNVECQWMSRLPASCQTRAPASHQRVTELTGAAGYSPLYYLPVGLPMLISPDYGGIIAGRLVSALLSALLLAAAVGVAVRLGNRLLIAALVLVATPMVMNLAGSINPNGLEIAAGTLLWTCLLALLRPSTSDAAESADPAVPSRLGESVTHRLVVLGTVAAVLLMTIRHMGPVLLGVALVAAAVLARPGRVRALLGRRDVRWAGGILVASGLLALVWILTSGVTDITAVPSRTHPYGPFDTLRLILISRVPFYLQQVIGQFSYGETTMPSWLIVGWYLPIAGLALPALLIAGRRYRVAMLGLLTACLAILVVLEFAFIHTAGWVAHSRYVMPAGVGLVLGAAFVRRWRIALGPAPAERLVKLAVLVAVPLQLWALGAVMTRFQIGMSALMDPFKGSWLPAGGPLPALTTEIVGLITLGILAWSVTKRPDRDPSVSIGDSTGVPSTH
jgi:hypothetical protein